MSKKYEMLLDSEYTRSGLHRIRALISFSDVNEGDIGGYIESEDNLAHIGDCWVYDNAEVTGNSYIEDNAKIHGNSNINDSTIKGNVEVFDNSVINNSTLEGSDFSVSGNAEISNVHIIGYELKISRQ